MNYDRFGFYISRVGLDDGKGNLSFNKLVTVVMVALFSTMVTKAINPEAPVLLFGTGIMAASFGVKAFIAFVTRKQAARKEGE